MNKMAAPNFDPIHPKTIIFSFSEFTPARKKSVHSINSFLRYSQFLSSVNTLDTPISDYVHPKIFWSTFHLFEFVPICKKSGYFVDLFWRYGRLKNPAILLAENILCHISWTKTFPNMGFVQEHCK